MLRSALLPASLVFGVMVALIVAQPASAGDEGKGNDADRKAAKHRDHDGKHKAHDKKERHHKKADGKRHRKGHGFNRPDRGRHHQGDRERSKMHFRHMPPPERGMRSDHDDDRRAHRAPRHMSRHTPRHMKGPGARRGFSPKASRMHGMHRWIMSLHRRGEHDKARKITERMHDMLEHRFSDRKRGTERPRRRQLGSRRGFSPEHAEKRRERFERFREHMAERREAREKGKHDKDGERKTADRKDKKAEKGKGRKGDKPRLDRLSRTIDKLEKQLDRVEKRVHHLRDRRGGNREHRDRDDRDD